MKLTRVVGVTMLQVSRSFELFRRENGIDVDGKNASQKPHLESSVECNDEKN